jgi:hypothetical protein
MDPSARGGIDFMNQHLHRTLCREKTAQGHLTADYADNADGEKLRLRYPGNPRHPWLLL